MLDHFFSLLFPKDSESLTIFDIRLREVGAKRPLNGTSKVNRHTDTETDRRTDRRTDILTYRKHRPRGPMLWKSALDSLASKCWLSRKIFWKGDFFFIKSCFLPCFVWISLKKKTKKKHPNRIEFLVLGVQEVHKGPRGTWRSKKYLKATCLFTRLEESSLVPVGFLQKT